MEIPEGQSIHIKGSSFNSLDSNIAPLSIPRMRRMNQQPADLKIPINASQKLPHAQQPC